MSPAKSRVVELICYRLCGEITQPRRETVDGHTTLVSRWKRILKKYAIYRGKICNNFLLISSGLTLYNINQTTLSRWYKSRRRQEQISSCLQSITPPSANLRAEERLLDPRPNLPEQIPHDPVEFDEPQDKSGQANVKGKKNVNIAL